MLITDFHVGPDGCYRLIQFQEVPKMLPFDCIVHILRPENAQLKLLNKWNLALLTHYI